MRTLQELADTLIALDTPIIEAEKIEAFVAHPSEQTGYVWPEFRDWNAEDGYRLVLIEAAGAVGKSAAAASLARALNWPLVDAAKAQVGDYSLSGLVHDALGFTSSYLADISLGRAGIIIDSLDEAHLRAGTSNFLAFLDNIHRLAGKPSVEPATLVLFSRPDTADTIKAHFIESKVPFANAAIQFFARDAACAFINTVMKRKSEDAAERRRRDEQGKKSATNFTERYYDVAVKHPIAFAALRDDRMANVASTLLNQHVTDVSDVWERVRSFLGYAPVLSVLAESLAVVNPHQAKKQIVTSSGSTRLILLEIIKHLLDREQDKFKSQMLSQLEARLPATDEWLGRELIYSPTEQAIRLVGLTQGSHLVTSLPQNLPNSLQQFYSDAVDRFISDHPFLSGKDAVNIVFHDYILARATVDQSCQLYLSPSPGMNNRVPGPFFYQFVHEFASEDNLSDPVIPESLLTHLLESRRRAITASEDRFVLVQRGEFAYLTFQDSNAILEFTVTDLTGVLEFPHWLSHGFVYSDRSVVLGKKGSSFLLGPAARVICAELEIDSDRLSVNPGLRGLEHSFLSSKRVFVSGPLKVDAPVSESLRIVGGDNWPALRPYVYDDNEAGKFLRFADYMDLRAVLRCFRQGMGALPSVYGELLEQRIVQHNPTRARFLLRLQEIGLIYRESALYYLKTSELARRNIDMNLVYAGQPSEGIFLLVQEINEIGKAGD